MPMSNTESLRRTDGGLLPLSKRGTGTLLASLLFTIALISFRPFQPAGAIVAPGEAIAPGGDIVNQLGFGSLGALALFALASFVDRRVLLALLSPWWLLLLGFVALAVLNTPVPMAAARSASFTLIGILVMAAALAVPRDADSFSTVLAVAGFSVVGLSYAGIVLLPGVAIHGPNIFEPEHVGFWRGAFSHKNVAGPVMACFSFVGIYLFRRGWRKAGGVLFLLALFFLSNTGSKTTAGLVPLAMLLVILPGVIGMRLAVPVLFVGTVAFTALATLGIVFFEPLNDIAHAVASDPTYTGRTSLWSFAGEMIAKRPWTGYGYENFWGTPLVTDIDFHFDREWDIRGIVHGHSGYIDVSLTMGLPGAVAAVIAFVLVPARDYMRVPMLKENVWLGDLFMMITLFTTLNAFLESFYFRRVDPVWLFLVFGVLGLRLAARFPVRSSSPN